PAAADDRPARPGADGQRPRRSGHAALWSPVRAPAVGGPVVPAPARAAGAADSAAAPDRRDPAAGRLCLLRPAEGVPAVLAAAHGGRDDRGAGVPAQGAPVLPRPRGPVAEPGLARIGLARAARRLVNSPRSPRPAGALGLASVMERPRRRNGAGAVAVAGPSGTG